MTDTERQDYAGKACGLESAVVARGADDKAVDSIGKVCALCIVTSALKCEIEGVMGALKRFGGLP